MTFSSGWTSVRQRSPSKSAGRSSCVTQRLPSRLGASVSATQPEHDPARAPAACEEEGDEQREREPDEHERARGQCVARQRQVVDERPREREPGAIPAHDEPRAERAHGRHDDPDREHAGQRLRAAAPTARSPPARQHGADIAELLGQVVAAEPRREIVQRRGPQLRHARRHEQVREVELEAAAADPERDRGARARTRGTAKPRRRAMP